MYIRSIFFISLLLLVIQSRVFSEDRQLWHTNTVEATLMDFWKVGVENQYRWENGVSDLFQYYIQGYVGFRLNPACFVTLNCRQNWRKIEKKDGTSIWEDTVEPLIDLENSYKVAGLTVKNRSRFQYVTGSKDWLYRNRVLVSANILPFSPYVSDEIFLKDFSTYQQNRFEVGIQPSLFGIFSANVAYMRRSIRRSGEWVNENVLRTGVELSF
ncbi:MAG: hypothetical protein Tsb0021_08450 [Chlamydiales bacterium]